MSVDDEGRWFPEPALVYDFAEGVTKPKAVQGKVAGIGTNYGAALRAKLAPQFIAHLATIHTLDVAAQPPGAFR